VQQKKTPSCGGSVNVQYDVLYNASFDRRQSTAPESIQIVVDTGVDTEVDHQERKRDEASSLQVTQVFTITKKHHYSPSIMWSFRVLSFVQPMAQHIVMAHLFFFEETVYPGYSFSFSSFKNKTVHLVSLTVAIFATTSCVFCWIYNWVMQNRISDQKEGMRNRIIDQKRAMQWNHDCESSDAERERAAESDEVRQAAESDEVRQATDSDIESQKALLECEKRTEPRSEKSEELHARKKSGKKSGGHSCFVRRFDFQTRFCMAAGMQLIGCVLFASAIFQAGKLSGIICYFAGCVFTAAGSSWWVGTWVGIRLNFVFLLCLSKSPIASLLMGS